MKTIEMVKTKRNNAIASSIRYENVDDRIYLTDNSDRNWRTSSTTAHGVKDAMSFLMRRGYKWVIVDGEYVPSGKYLKENGYFEN